MSKHEYRGFYKKHNLEGVVNIGTGKIMVHSVMRGTPLFMRDADCIFVDPPCSNGNLSSFYTKAGAKKTFDIDAFNVALLNCIFKINPENIFMEVFKSNKKHWEEKFKKLDFNVSVFESFYYGSKKNECWIIHASKEKTDFDIPFMDEENVIEHICKNFNFSCIADPCMGKGLVGFYANKYGKKFVGTELNKKRLACLIEHINVGKIIVR